MRRSVKWGCVLLMSMLALAIVPVALAGEDTDTEGQYKLEGTWWRDLVAGSGGPAFLSVIVQVGPQEWSGTFVNLEDVSLGEVLDYFGTTRTSEVVSTIVRTGVNKYKMTTISYFGDDKFSAPYRGTVWAFIASGTLTQDGPDHFLFEFSYSASCNPCHPWCWSYNATTCDSLGDLLWDPFADPYRLCGGTGAVGYRRVPVDDRCQ